MEYKPLEVPASAGFSGTHVEGGVCVAQGFRAAAVHAGFQPDPNRLDLAMVVADQPAAVVFTTNVFCAAPVTVDREHIAKSGYARAFVANTKYANAATGQPGLANAYKTAELAAQVLGCPAEQVLVASTGIIGQHLNMDTMAQGLPAVAAQLGRDAELNDHAAARAIMTTDTKPKRCAVAWRDESGAVYHVGGMCKGSGMISPNMATMICLITTDAPVAPAVLDQALHAAVNLTFNRVTVDSDTSTNDTCIVMASGAAGGEPIEAAQGSRYDTFAAALLEVCSGLARQIAADGEGATRLVSVTVMGAASDADAELAARTVATSPLVKTAIAGHDANWGRIAAALGRSGAKFDQYDVDIDILGIPVCRGGLVVSFDEDEALRRFEQPQVDIVCDLGAGAACASIWTCDLTHGYISINADYRS
jgi:glutamate N-acetyltransferase / amino-acid N-acetyltransferase